MNSHRPSVPAQSGFQHTQVESHSPSSADFTAMVTAARDEVPGAMSALLQTLLPMVVRYCRARMNGRDFSYLSAEDVAQEVCLAVLRALPAYQDRGGSFLYLVRAIASNKVIDAYRTSARDRSEPVAELPEFGLTENEPEQHALELDLRTRIARLLEFLPPQHREILVFRLVVGLSAEETGQALGISAGNVRVVQHRALERLRGLVKTPRLSSLAPCGESDR